MRNNATAPATAWGIELTGRMQTKWLELYLAQRSALIEYAAGIVGDRARAEDVVHDAWLRLEDVTARSAHVVNQPKSYLYQIVRNLAIDLSRRLAREIRGPEADAIFAVVPESAPDPEVEAIGKEELANVVSALQELPERTREAFRLHRLESRTYREIALELGISQALAHKLVQAAVSHCLRRMMDQPL